jgi:hypothetical protein
MNMASTVKSRPNHYEVLGLAPTASSDEIAQAFAREISIFRPHSFGGIAEVTVAYETLRNPARRRAYDAELGLDAKPEPKHVLSSSGVGGASFLNRPGSFAETVERPAKPDSTPFIAAALRELASPEPLRRAVEAPAPEPQLAEPGEDFVRLELGNDPDIAEEGSPPWKRIGILAGGLVLAVGIAGAWAGWMAGNGKVPERPEAAALVTLPPPTTFAVGDPAQAAAAPMEKQAPVARPKRPALAAARTRRARPPSRLASLEEQLAEPVAAKADPQAPGAAPATVAASMPLPNRVVARTIARIGYPCGEVASTTAGGSPGVFTVTCTSGHSYQAAPVRGRYHFRRLSGR